MLFRNEMNGNINLNHFSIKNTVLCILFLTLIIPSLKKYHKSLACNFGHLCCLLFCARCDSMTWNPHKMMGVPLQCSAILVRNSVIVVVWIWSLHIHQNSNIIHSQHQTLCFRMTCICISYNSVCWLRKVSLLVIVISYWIVTSRFSCESESTSN